MKLQRCDIVGDFDIKECDTGSLVYVDDALDWFESLLEDMRVPVSTIPEELHAIATNKERARLRALIAAERGKV